MSFRVGDTVKVLKNSVHANRPFSYERIKPNDVVVVSKVDTSRKRIYYLQNHHPVETENYLPFADVILITEDDAGYWNFLDEDSPPFEIGDQVVELEFYRYYMKNCEPGVELDENIVIVTEVVFQNNEWFIAGHYKDDSRTSRYPAKIYIKVQHG